MWETYLNLESIARQFKEVVLETKIFKLPSDEPSKLRIELVDGSFADVWSLYLENILIIGIGLRSTEQYIASITHHIKHGHM